MKPAKEMIFKGGSNRHLAELGLRNWVFPVLKATKQADAAIANSPRPIAAVIDNQLRNWNLEVNGNQTGKEIVSIRIWFRFENCDQTRSWCDHGIQSLEFRRDSDLREITHL
jgi:hypothetical protein